MTPSHSTLRRLAAVSVLMSLAACGGGSNSAPAPTPPADGGTAPAPAPVSAPPPAPVPEPPPAPVPAPPAAPVPPPPAVATAIPHTVAATPGAFFVALDAAGQGLAWGTYTNALGSGAALPQSAARTVPILAISVEAGATYTVAVGKDGKAYGWGFRGTDGALGNFTFAGPQVAAVPVELPGVDSIVQVAMAIGTLPDSTATAFHYSLALRADGSVWHWPGAITYDLGDPANVKATVAPRQIAGLSNVVALSRHGESGQSLAIKADGTVWKINLIGRGTVQTGMVHEGTAVQVTGLSGIAEASCDTLTCLSLTTDGKVFAWGSNTFGQLGNNSVSTVFSPIEVTGLPTVAGVSMWAGSSCALSEDGRVWYWGVNPSNGDLPPVLTPTLLTTIDAVVEFDGCTSIMRRSDGSVWGLGSGNASRLGGGVAPPDGITPEPVPGIQLN